MIESTFILLNGIGETTERKLWEHGVASWQAFLGELSLPGIGRSRKSLYDQEVSRALHHHGHDDARYFSECLKPRDQWRLYPWLRSRAVYLDIETAGGSFGDVTVVGLYAEGRMTSLVRGDSLTQDRLRAELSRYDLLITFFGSAFDLPYLKASYPRLVLDQPHIDLCFLARRLGFRGGLKRIEPLAGIERSGPLQGLDGWDAVRLWNRWRYGHDPAALELLLAYNEADAMNLQPLADFLYDQLAQQYKPYRDQLSASPAQTHNAPSVG
jgi:uncharacterized protein YprB with RNaseH-like and TPR domain